MSETAFAARHSMDSPEWYTPSPIVEAARAVMGGIDLDPASHEEANQIVTAEKFFTAEEDGLAHFWGGRVFINPPGGLVGEFWRKLLVEVAAERVSQFVWIGYSLEQLQTLQSLTAPLTPLDYCLCIPRRRIAFVENEAKRVARIAKLVAAGKTPNQRSQPSHGNYIAYGGYRKLSFREQFSQFGQVVLR